MLSAEGLAKADTFGKSDAYAKIYLDGRHVGDTRLLLSSSSPNILLLCGGLYGTLYGRPYDKVSPSRHVGDTAVAPKTLDPVWLRRGGIVALRYSSSTSYQIP